jgi:Zn-finger nucleic acid-binding protein
VYRDAFERCPRCGIELVDASAARGCKQCAGLWIGEDVLTEMVMKMLPPTLDAPWMARRLRFAPSFPSTDAPGIPCPSCHEPMARAMLHRIVIDRCETHGIWFDGDELGSVLRRCADPSIPQPLLRTGVSMFPGPARKTPPPVPESPPPPPSPPPAPRATAIELTIYRPGRDVRVVRVDGDIIKIGRHDRAHVHLDDPAVDRMHAIIEIDDGVVTLIDLGSSGGTRVNDERINKLRLASGDVVEIGESRLILSIKD